MPKKSSGTGNETKSGDVQCFLCKGFGHKKANCPKGKTNGPVTPKAAPAPAPAVMKRVVIQESIKIGDRDEVRADGLRRVEICVGDVLMNMLLDTGSNINVVSNQVVTDMQSLGIECEVTQSRPRVVQMVASGASVRLDGRIAKLSFNVVQYGVMVEDEFYIMESVDEDLVMGLDSMRKWGLIKCLESLIQGVLCPEEELQEKMEYEVLFSVEEVEDVY